MLCWRVVNLGIAVDTPERLRENRFGVKTHIVLAERSDSLQHEVARLPFVRGVQWRDTTLVVTLTDELGRVSELRFPATAK